MRITTSDDYYHGWDCDRLRDCARVYCARHRVLYRECETAVEGWEGDSDVINGTRRIIEVTGDCPTCVREARQKKYEVLDKP